MFGSLVDACRYYLAGGLCIHSFRSFYNRSIELYKIGPNSSAAIFKTGCSLLLHLVLRLKFRSFRFIHGFPMHTFRRLLPEALYLQVFLLKMGTYGLLRFCLPLFPQAAIYFAPVISVLAVIGIIYGALGCYGADRYEKACCLFFRCSPGICCLGIFALTQESIQGAVIQMVNHGLIYRSIIPFSWSYL